MLGLKPNKLGRIESVTDVLSGGDVTTFVRRVKYDAKGFILQALTTSTRYYFTIKLQL
jgi:hypothetical protein